MKIKVIKSESSGGLWGRWPLQDAGKLELETGLSSPETRALAAFSSVLRVRSVLMTSLVQEPSNPNVGYILLKQAYYLDGMLLYDHNIVKNIFKLPY